MIVQQQLIKESDELRKPICAVTGRQDFFTKNGRVEANAAGSKTEGQASLREVIDGDELLGEWNRMTEVR